MCGDCRAVMKPRFRTQQETIGQAVAGNTHRFRNQPVHAVRLVGSARHQRRECQFHALRRVAAQDVAVERIEGQERLVELPRRSDLREHTALWRRRIDVIEMGEVGRVFQIAEGGHAMCFALIRRQRAAHPSARHDAANGGGTRSQFQNRATVGRRHERFLAFAAFSASHHQTVGKAAAPYFGISFGWPKRSHRAVRCLP